MADRVVLDASVAVKWFLKDSLETDTDLADDILVAPHNCRWTSRHLPFVTFAPFCSNRLPCPRLTRPDAAQPPARGRDEPESSGQTPGVLLLMDQARRQRLQINLLLGAGARNGHAAQAVCCKSPPRSSPGILRGRHGQGEPPGIMLFRPLKKLPPYKLV